MLSTHSVFRIGKRIWIAQQDEQTAAVLRCLETYLFLSLLVLGASCWSFRRLLSC